MRPGPALCVVELDDLLKTCQELSRDFARRAASLNTAPVTLAALSKECATVNSVVGRFAHFLRHYTGLPGVDTSLVNDICDGPLLEISTCISHLHLASTRLPRASEDNDTEVRLAIIWNEHVLKQLLRDLGANRTSLEFLTNCAIR